MNSQQFTQQGKYLMLAIDHRGSFLKLLNPHGNKTVTDEDSITVKSEILESMHEYFSGVLLDAQYGLPAFKSRSEPFLLAIEKTGYSDQSGERVTELEYTVEGLKRMGASGVKLLLYFNPGYASSAQQIETAQRVLEECRKYEMPLFLEIVTYEMTPSGMSKSQIITRSVEMFLSRDVKPDVFKLEFPGDQQSCRKITELCGEIPWILLTRAAAFEQFAEELRVASAEGAQGFLAGRSIWQEIGIYNTKEERLNYLKTTAVPRFKKICEIALA